MINNSTDISIDKDINVAKTMPSRFYIQEEYYDLTIKNIFYNSWQYVIDQKSYNKNSILPFIHLKKSINEPLLLTYYKDSFLALSNVCTHRGSILCDKIVSGNKIKCPYHGRTFNACGDVVSAPGFDKRSIENNTLKKYKIKKWNNLLFCSLTGKINIDSVFNDIKSRLHKYPFEKLEYNSKKSQEYEVNAHWALYCENYLEGFHIPFVHKGLNDDINFNSYNTILLENGVLQFTLSQEKEKCSYLNNAYAYYYWIFPNIMLNFYSWGLSINIIEPIRNDKTKIKFLSFPIKGFKVPNTGPSSLDTVEKEDQEIILKVQKGMLSKTYNRGIYSPKYELGVHHFHRLLSKYL